MKKALVVCGAALLAVLAPAVASADVKARKTMVMEGMPAGSMEMVEYVKGKRMRTETRMGGNVVAVQLQQCDLGRMVQINDATKKYYVMPLSGGDATATPAAPAAKPQKGGVVNVTTTIVDTGERKQVHGMTARRIKTTMLYEPGPGACNQTKSKIETDGWYVDLDGYGDGCGVAASASMGAMGAGGCQDEIRTKVVGSAKLGYPVWLKVDMGVAGAAPTFEVVELSKEAIDAAMFEVPAGYTQVSSFTELMTP